MRCQYRALRLASDFSIQAYATASDSEKLKEDSTISGARNESQRPDRKSIDTGAKAFKYDIGSHQSLYEPFGLENALGQRTANRNDTDRASGAWSQRDRDSSVFTDEWSSPFSSRYNSIVSERMSIGTFYSARSRQSHYSHKSTASNMSRRTMWQQLLHEKNLVPLKSNETDWSGRGQHVEFSKSESSIIEEILKPEGVLGHTASALVHKVRCRRIMLARKSIRCNYHLKKEDAIEEVAHLQRLSHSHIVRAVGTYVQGTYLSILLYPATSYNLETFLELYDELSSNPICDERKLKLHNVRRSIFKFVKCLVNTVAYLHENLVKHRDIKPTNILVQENEYAGFSRMYLADFGIAKSYQTAADAETESRTPFSRSYASPEVIRQDVRGFPADIFSLGCVILEMLSAVTGRKELLLRVRQANAEGDQSYQANVDAFREHGMFENDYVETGGPVWLLDNTKFYSEPGSCQGWLEQMMDSNPQARPTAAGLSSAVGVDDWCCSQGPQPFEAELPALPTLTEAD